ncbi:Cellobiose phosphorylase [Halolactibacillus halophilus]|uniref:Cellobiose phosphorylase n=1 Tax=Halolactibacillus halophilus TaxID=306540 RepID=A0A1I5M7F8_9BACI|nr:cellobiose phosphorylase [Halolactibacillus halophilus]GEM01023.1 hypothetical protein HHA03_05550 [Halolactibacillus halophilus]SFP04876.1 Cellobiose phosphorylase [Halolactibacillus halophilus]
MTHQPLRLKKGDISFEFLTTGDIKKVQYQSIMINQWISNPLDGSLNQLYLRIHDDEIKSYPLLGVKAGATFNLSETKATYKGKVEGLNYQVTLEIGEENTWFYTVDVDNDGRTIDMMYGQDIGLGDPGAVRNNEAYVSQYIDHSVYEVDNSYVVCSRQNQGQSTGHPYLEQGSLNNLVGYATDGFQFFGLDYKETDIPIALTKSLPNDIYQYEFAYTSLQTEKTKTNERTAFVFYGHIQGDHPNAVTKPLQSDKVQAIYDRRNTQITSAIYDSSPKVNEQIGKVIVGESLTKEEINKLYPNRIEEEFNEGELLAFFTKDYEHVVLKAKERLVERPHGHILMGNRNDHVTDETLTSTTFMYGLFNAQLVLGNTSFNKWISNQRNALNVMKASGQRIYINDGEHYRLMTVPSSYHIGLNFTRWTYKFKEDVIVVTAYTSLNDKTVKLEVTSESGKAYKYLVTNQVTMNTNEHDQSFIMKTLEKELIFKATETSDSAPVYPQLSYKLGVKGADFDVYDGRFFVENSTANESSLVVLEITATDALTITVQGTLDDTFDSVSSDTFEQETATYKAYYKHLLNDFDLTLKGERLDEIEKVNALAYWYTHNMLVHFSVPHGLEQYSGAAWGTRDVCQGPIEYFLATENYKTTKEIILNIFKHQFEDDGNWPQWFMFDRCHHIKAGESHGDIIVWPLKVMGDYLEKTGDFSILDEKVPYTVRGVHNFTEESYSVMHHLEKEIAYIKTHFLHETALSSYGDGDWDDTLQPANKQLKQYMVSSWTVALTYQVLAKLEKVFDSRDKEKAVELGRLADQIKADFERYMLNTDVIPGFLYLEDSNNPVPMLHPDDEATGIHYRLLPMQRSIISELVPKTVANRNYQLIQEHLACPDGVRLMNRPANYQGGVNTHFQRAETAANFGREIGLQYVHAHIRYAEAMAKLGKEDEVWSSLEKINPIGIQKIVPNAELRQSNAYFSSSDGKFNDRYEAQANFAELRNGKRAVKGGWRIYSSGPGIYLNQLISQALGIRPMHDRLVIDPILPDHLDGLAFQFNVYRTPVVFNYHLHADKSGIIVNNHAVAVEKEQSPYRSGGLIVNKQALLPLLMKEDNVIDIYIQR